MPAGYCIGAGSPFWKSDACDNWQNAQGCSPPVITVCSGSDPVSEDVSRGAPQPCRAISASSRDSENCCSLRQWTAPRAILAASISTTANSKALQDCFRAEIYPFSREAFKTETIIQSGWLTPEV